MIKKLLLLILLAAVAAGLVLRYHHLPAPLPAESASAQWLQKGPFPVSYFDISLKDDTRPTRANGSFAGSDARKLRTRIWYPKTQIVQAPLVIYSHGFMSNRGGGSYLAEHLASHGYLVAAMDYPLTNYFAPGGPLVQDVVNQPGDISFLLDQMLSWNRETGHQFFNAIDENRIAAIGLSLGGLTSTLVAFHPQMGDPRIAAAVSIAGPSYVFSTAFFRFRTLPFLMIASPQDPMVPYADNAADTPERVPGSLLVSLAGGSHTGFASLGRYFRWLDNPDSLGCRQVRKGLANGDGEDWSGELGSREQGIVVEKKPEICAQQVLPPAMNPVRQHWLTTLAVSSFLESRFALGEADRLRARDYLQSTMADELDDVAVRRAAF